MKEKERLKEIYDKIVEMQIKFDVEYEKLETRRLFLDEKYTEYDNHIRDILMKEFNFYLGDWDWAISDGYNREPLSFEEFYDAAKDKEKNKQDIIKASQETDKMLDSFTKDMKELIIKYNLR
jgi:hypothetical protein